MKNKKSILIALIVVCALLISLVIGASAETDEIGAYGTVFSGWYELQSKDGEITKAVSLFASIENYSVATPPEEFGFLLQRESDGCILYVNADTDEITLDGNFGVALYNVAPDSYSATPYFVPKGKTEPVFAPSSVDFTVENEVTIISQPVLKGSSFDLADIVTDITGTDAANGTFTVVETGETASVSLNGTVATFNESGHVAFDVETTSVYGVAFDVLDGPQKLPTPEISYKYNGATKKTLKINPVKNATGYEYYNCSTTSNTTTKTTLNLAKEGAFRIRALGDGVCYLDSDFAELYVDQSYGSLDTSLNATMIVDFDNAASLEFLKPTKMTPVGTGGCTIAPTLTHGNFSNTHSSFTGILVNDAGAVTSDSPVGGVYAGVEYLFPEKMETYGKKYVGIKLAFATWGDSQYNYSYFGVISNGKHYSGVGTGRIVTSNRKITADTVETYANYAERVPNPSGQTTCFIVDVNAIKQAHPEITTIDGIYYGKQKACTYCVDSIFYVDASEDVLETPDVKVNEGVNGAKFVAYWNRDERADGYEVVQDGVTTLITDDYFVTDSTSEISVRAVSSSAYYTASEWARKSIDVYATDPATGLHVLADFSTESETQVVEQNGATYGNFTAVNTATFGFGSVKTGYNTNHTGLKVTTHTGDYYSGFNYPLEKALDVNGVDKIVLRVAYSDWGNTHYSNTVISLNANGTDYNVTQYASTIENFSSLAVDFSTATAIGSSVYAHPNFLNAYYIVDVQSFVAANPSVKSVTGVGMAFRKDNMTTCVDTIMFSDRTVVDGAQTLTTFATAEEISKLSQNVGKPSYDVTASATLEAGSITSDDVTRTGLKLTASSSGYSGFSYKFPSPYSSAELQKLAVRIAYSGWGQTHYSNMLFTVKSGSTTYLVTKYVRYASGNLDYSEVDFETATAITSDVLDTHNVLGATYIFDVQAFVLDNPTVTTIDEFGLAFKKAFTCVVDELVADVKPSGVPKENNDILINGKSIREYVISSDSSMFTLCKAESVLQDEIYNVVGYSLPIVSADAENRIELVFDNNCDDEHYEVRSTKYGVLISGGLRGIIYGTYAFLEEAVGIGYYAEDCIVYPTGTVVVSDRVNYNHDFVIKYRDWLGNYLEDDAFGLARNINSNNWGIHNYGENEGGGYTFATVSAHSITGEYALEAYKETHPEYFSLVNGKRMTDRMGQICLTNQDAIDAVIGWIKGKLRQYPDAQFASVTQGDNENFCQCDNCKEALKTTNIAGLYLRFVNQVADAVKDEYPNVLIHTFAYGSTNSFPTGGEIARENVIIQYCTGSLCREHSIYDENCAQNAYIRGEVAKWAGICSHMMIWDYPNNFKYELIEVADFYNIRDYIRFYAENKAFGVFNEADHIANGDCSTMQALKAYLTTICMANPYISEQEYSDKMDEFLNAYYGRGGAYIRQYIDAWCDKTSGAHYNYDMGSFGTGTSPVELMPNSEAYDFCEQMLALWDKAYALATTPEQRERIEKDSTPTLFYQVYWTMDGIVSKGTQDQKNAIYEKNKLLISRIINYKLKLTFWGETVNTQLTRMSASNYYLTSPKNWRYTW